MRQRVGVEVSGNSVRVELEDSYDRGVMRSQLVLHSTRTALALGRKLRTALAPTCPDDVLPALSKETVAHVEEDAERTYAIVHLKKGGGNLTITREVVLEIAKHLEIRGRCDC